MKIQVTAGLSVLDIVPIGTPIATASLDIVEHGIAKDLHFHLAELDEDIEIVPATNFGKLVFILNYGAHSALLKPSTAPFSFLIAHPGIPSVFFATSGSAILANPTTGSTDLGISFIEYYT